MDPEKEKEESKIVSTDAVIEEDTEIELADGEGEPEPPVEEVETKAEGEEAPTEPAEPEEETVPKSIMLRRLAREAAKSKAAAEERDALKAELEAARGTKEDVPLTPEDVQKQARVMAAQMAAETKLNDACATAAELASKSNPKFWEEWTAAIDAEDGAGAPPRVFLEHVVELDNPDAVLNALAKDSIKLERLYHMTPAKQAIELAKMSESLKKPVKAVSKAPAPIEPVGGNRGSPGVLTDNMPVDDWIAQRNKQIANNPRMRR